MGRRSRGERISAWFASVAVRTGLAVVGSVVVVKGLLLIGAAQHGLTQRC